LTIETRGLIQPQDITAVEFECRTCGSKVVRAIQDFKQVPARCENCDEQWIIWNSEAHAKLFNFIKRVGDFAGANEPYILRFEVKGLTDLKR
jgi:DNA-directed RNA polymerase subunit RPC12/RpoP